MNGPDLGIEGLTAEDLRASGSRYGEVRDAIFANPYQPTWKGPDAPGLPVHRVTLRRALRGVLPFGRPYGLFAATRRSIASQLDLRWGPDRRGFRRLVHANGICLLGSWEITAETGYSGYFRQGSRGLVVARFSTCCTETRSGHSRSMGLAGRIYPTTDTGHSEPLQTANFITQEDVGGNTLEAINEVRLSNAPDTTSWRRGLGLPILLVAGACSLLTDRHITERQLYQIAELGKDPGEKTCCPRYLRLTVDPAQPVVEGEALDFRDEIMAQIYDREDPTPRRKLIFRIEVADEGHTVGWLFYERRRIRGWKEIGSITFDEAVVSYNGDFVLAFNHPAWRTDRNNTGARVRGVAAEQRDLG